MFTCASLEKALKISYLLSSAFKREDRYYIFINKSIIGVKQRKKSTIAWILLPLPKKPLGKELLSNLVSELVITRRPDQSWLPRFHQDNEYPRLLFLAA